MSVNEVKYSRRSASVEALRIMGTPTARTFCLGREDHTLGNALRHVLLASDSQNVEFAGYSVPHPSEPVVQIRVQTSASDSDSDPPSITAAAALQRACATLREQCETVRERLEEALPYVREDRLHVEKLLLEQQRMDDEEEEAEEDDEMDTTS